MYNLYITEEEMDKLTKVLDLLLKKTGLENLELALEANNILARAILGGEMLKPLDKVHAEEFHNNDNKK